MAISDGEIPQEAEGQPSPTLVGGQADISNHASTFEDCARYDNGSNGFPLPAAKRVRTAPAETTSRPEAGLRVNSFLTGRKKDVRDARKQDGKGDSFSYKFDSMTSDSDSSSSSEDEAPAQSEERAPKSEKKTGAATQGDDTSKGNHERRRFSIGNDYFRTKGRVSRRDGRLKISINETANSGFIAKALGQSIRNHLDIPRRDENGVERSKKKQHTDGEDDKTRQSASTLPTTAPIPRLNIVIMVIGSRGDIQPFLRIGQILSETHGHRVRIASHPVFREFVESLGLEFFDVGGDPSELMAFMVKNPGLIPNMQTLREGEIGRRRAAMAVMFDGFWKACITDSEKDGSGMNMRPFIADAIIANPPSMAHVHIAERLGIPLHIMFTFPYTPTTQFPHPLANIKTRSANIDAGYVNFMSYPLVEMMTWQGLGDIVNRFRENTMRLEPVSSLWAPGALYRMKVPYTYMWSPGLVPKPADWGPEIDLSGFVFLDLAQNFDPPRELVDFLNDGEPPVYIGFGSIVVDDPNKFTDMIFKAVEMVGVRALVSKGWGGFGRDNDNTPKNIHMLGNIPHDWLFPRVKAVVHHGGAGTTAIGLKCGRPTMIVPFFGDQPFWGARVAEAKAGAFQCIPYKKLTADRLAEGIRQCLTEEAQRNVQDIADSIIEEGDGAKNAVDSFHRSLPLAGRHSMRCSILQDKVAVWKMRNSSLRLSALAAQLLHENGKLKWDDLKLIHHYQWNDFDGPGEPITGGIGAISDSLYGIGEGFGMVPVRIARHIRKHEEHQRKKRDRQKRRAERNRRKSGRDTTNTTGQDEEQPTPTREDTTLTTTSTISVEPSEPLSMEVIEDLHWGLRRAGAAILTMPNDLHVAIAQGLHNAPRLYGDATIRKPVRIKGFKSGIKAARKEFTYGIYDGWTGLVKQPKGDWEDGETVAAKFAGLGTGLGKGVGGFVIKNANAVYAPPAFVVKGLIKHVENRSDGPGCKALIRRRRILQGETDLHELQDDNDAAKCEQLQEIKERVEHGWNVYEDIWNTAQQYFGPVRGNLIGKYKMKREKKLWDVNGALENVDTANRTLEARKEGYDIEEIFARQREDASQAERAKASASDTSINGTLKGSRGGDDLLNQDVPRNDQAGTSVSTTQNVTNDLQRLKAVTVENGNDPPRPIDDLPLHLRKVSTIA